MEKNTEVFSTLGRDNPAVLLVVATCMALTVAMLGEPRSSIRERPLRGCQARSAEPWLCHPLLLQLPRLDLRHKCASLGTPRFIWEERLGEIGFVVNCREDLDMCVHGITFVSTRFRHWDYTYTFHFEYV